MRKVLDNRSGLGFSHHVSNETQNKTTTMTTAYLNEITTKISAFKSFDELLNAGGNYRPSIYLKKGDHKNNRAKMDLVNAYDDAQQQRGDSRRAFRGNW